MQYSCKSFLISMLSYVLLNQVPLSFPLSITESKRFTNIPLANTSAHTESRITNGLSPSVSKSVVNNYASAGTKFLLRPVTFRVGTAVIINFWRVRPA